MFKKTNLLIITASLISLGCIFVSTQTANAVAASEWKAGNIIDDALFIDANSMTVTQIQAFLNSKVPICDTMGTNGSTSTSRRDYVRSLGYDIPLTCLRDFYEVPKTVPGPGIPANNYGGKPIPTGAKSAAQLIWDAAQQYDISPKVLLVKLGTESAGPLTSDDWPLLSQYTYAMGAHCPDSGPGGSANCDTNYSGFSIQIAEAAKLLRGYLDNMTQPYWPYKKPYQTNSIYWNVVPSGCGASDVFIETKATAALYTYTPYQPNQAALDNMYSTGDSCSAYGNRNFWRTYNDWFGSTKFPQPIGAMLYRQSTNGRIYLVADNKRFYISSTSIMNNYGLDTYSAVPASDSTIAATVDGGTLTNIIRDDNGSIYLVNNGYKYHIPSSTVCTNWAISCFDTKIVRNLGDALTNIYLKSGADLNNTAYYSGVYYEMSSGTRLPYADLKSFTDSGFSTSGAIKANQININQPLGKLQLTTPGLVKFSPKNTIYYFNGTNYYIVPSMSIYSAWNLGSINTINAPKSTYNTTDNPTVYSYLDISYTDKTSKSHVISNGNNYLISDTQATLWSTLNYPSGLDSLAARLKPSTMGRFLKNSFNIYRLSSKGTKDPIPTFNDYYGLGGNESNITAISNQLSSAIPTGPVALASGQLVRIDSTSSLYVTNGEGLLSIPNMNTLRAYHFKSAGLCDSDLFKNHYPISGVLGITRNNTGLTYIPYNGSLISLTANQTISFGLKPDISPALIDNNFIADSVIKPASSFLKNIDNGRIYYASGGSLHYVATINALLRYGGNTTPIIPIDTNVLNNFSIKQTLY